MGGWGVYKLWTKIKLFFSLLFFVIKIVYFLGVGGVSEFLTKLDIFGFF